VAGVQDVPGVIEHDVQIEDLVIGQDHDRVRGFHFARRQLGPDHAAVDVLLGYIRIRGSYVRAKCKEAIGYLQGGRLARVSRIALVGQSKEEKSTSVDCLSLLIQPRDQTLDYVVGHMVIDVSCKFDETKRTT
jgi:hypothetical protein